MNNLKLINKENSKRLSLLKASGVDVEGFGYLNTFFLSDEIICDFNWLSKISYKLNFFKLALYFSDISTYQYKYKGFEIRQVIEIIKKYGAYKQDGYVHDQCTDEALEYISEKYNFA